MESQGSSAGCLGRYCLGGSTLKLEILRAEIQGGFSAPKGETFAYSLIGPLWVSPHPSEAPNKYLISLSLYSLLGFWPPLISRGWLKELPVKGYHLSPMHGRQLLCQGTERAQIITN